MIERMRYREDLEPIIERLMRHIEMQKFYYNLFPPRPEPQRPDGYGGFFWEKRPPYAALEHGLRTYILLWFMRPSRAQAREGAYTFRRDPNSGTYQYAR